jgi:tetratricopeptide (TPR) repeat protein
LSAGGQHAVVVTRDGTVFDWDVQGSKVNEISFDLARIASDSEKADGTNPLAKRDILSIARDPKSQHVALMIATEGHNPRIIVSKADDGAGPQVDVNVLARKIEEHSQVDLSSASLVGYSGGLLITELHLRGQSDGLFLLNAKTGEVETLFSWPVIGRSRLTPDGQTVLIVTGWDPTQGCQSTAGGLADESATGDNSTFSGGGSSCLVLIDLERRKGTILAHLPVDSAVLDIATAATGRGSPTTYEVLLRAAGAYRFLKIVRADDGDYSVEGGANADAAPFIESHPNDLPTQPALPLLFRVGRSFTGVARSGQVVVAADITNDRDLALAITRYEDETPAVDPIAGRVRVHFHSFNLQSPGLSTVIPASPIYHRRGRSRESQSGLQGALDGDGHYLLLVFQSDAAPGQMFGAFIDLQDTNGADRVASWVPIQPNTDVCGDAKNIQFGDIRYWGNQQRDASPSSRTSAFIGVDDNNNLWRTTVDYDPTSPKITLDCLNRLFGRAQILDAGGDQGLAVVQSNSTYVYSLFANVNSGATYSQTALDLPRAPQAAALLQSKIALAMDNGDIWTAEPRPEWSVALALRGAVSHVAALASDKQNLLVTADNGFALLLAFDSGRLSPVGTARLPMAGLDDYQLSLDTAHNAVRVIYAGTMDRYDLRSSPAGKDIESLIAARGSVVPKSKRDWADLLMRLSGAANQVELPHSALINVDDSAKCRLTINALLTFEDVEFEGNKPPLRRLSELTGAAKRDCGQAQSNASPAAVPLAIVHVVENLGKEANRWPIEWSLLLQAAERGDRAALRTYLLALNSSKSALIQKVARSVWSQLQRPGIFVARDQIRRCSTGDTLTRLDKDQLEDRFDADDGDKHMLVGCLLDRDAATTSERSKALRHFWLAEELYRISGRADDEATASRRRAALARALPDETIRAVRRDLAAWQIEGKSAAAPPFGAVPESASERFARDADRLQTIDESLSHDHLLVPLRTVLLWQLAQSLRAENESSARQSYRQAVEVLESTSAGPLLDPVSLMEWSSELADFHEHALAARVLIKALGSFKDNNANNIDGMNTYRRVVSALSDEVTTSAEARDVATKYLRFDPFLFGYGSRTVAREAHEDTLKLINSILPVSDVNVNWRIQRGVTQFWLGVIAKDGASRDSTPETQVQRLKEAAAQYFKDAARDFKLAEAQQASNLDLEFMQAELLRYSGNTHVDFREYDQAAREFEQAARKYEDVIAATESKTRSFPLPLADLLSVFASVQDNLSFQAIRFAESVPQFDGRLNNELEAKFRSLVWSSVDSAQRFELARKRADEVSESDTWAARQGIGFGYTIALLNGYIRFLHDPSHSAVPACDLLASAFVDPLRRSPGTIVFGSRDFGDAKSPCEEALSTHPDDPHNMFMVSRVTDDLALAVSAAKANYAAGFNEIAYEIQESKGYKNEDSRNGTLHSYYDRMCQAYTQRVLLVSFPDVYSYLKGDASAERRRGPLQWIAAKAAALGMPEGHFGLAELMEDNVDRWIHLQLAAKFAGGARPGDVQGRVFGKTAAEIENLAAGISLTDEERRKAQETVDAWPQPEALIEVPPELFDEVQKARDLSK